MNTRIAFFSGLAFLAAALLFAACSNPSGGDDDNGEQLATAGSDGYFRDLYFVSGAKKYFSLSSGREIDPSKSNTAEWDFALESEGFWVNTSTNSGKTAEDLGSPGNGGVWFTNKKDFDGTVFSDRVTAFSGLNAEFAPYVTDVERYQGNMPPAPSSPVRMNMMNYHGFYSGDGTQGNPFTIHPQTPGRPFFSFNRKGYTYSPAGMPPKWYPTGQVYVIRHADGLSYSKIQVTSILYISGYNFRLSFRYKNISDDGGVDKPLMVPGTYTGTAYGYGSTPLTVGVVLTETAISSVMVTSHAESSTRPEVLSALSSIPQAIVSDQDLEPDAITGATFTSKGIINAVRNCVFQAGDGRAVGHFGATALYYDEPF